MAGNKINWIERARIFIAQFTGKNTPLKALNYFIEKLNGDAIFVEMVAKAMASSFEEGKKSVKGVRTDAESQ